MTIVTRLPLQCIKYDFHNGVQLQTVQDFQRHSTSARVILPYYILSLLSVMYLRSYGTYCLQVLALFFQPYQRPIFSPARFS